jgi:hypothetical protein
MNIQIARDGHNIGEYSEDLIPTLLKLGAIKQSDYYWCEGMAEWDLVATRWPEVSSTPAADCESSPPVANPCEKSADVVDVSVAEPQLIPHLTPPDAKGYRGNPNGYFYRLATGRFGLWKTLWLHLLAVSLLHTIVKVFAGRASADQMASHLRLQEFIKDLPPPTFVHVSSTYLTLTAFFLWYETCAAIGVWKASTNYSGLRLWAWLAKAVCVLALILTASQWLQLLFVLIPAYLQSWK